VVNKALGFRGPGVSFKLLREKELAAMATLGKAGLYDKNLSDKPVRSPQPVDVQEQVGGEGVPQSVIARMVGDASLALGLVERPLETSFVQMVTISGPDRFATPTATLQAAPLGLA
jgi:hypothetical protein